MPTAPDHVAIRAEIDAIAPPLVETSWDQTVRWAVVACACVARICMGLLMLGLTICMTVFGAWIALNGFALVWEEYTTVGSFSASGAVLAVFSLWIILMLLRVPAALRDGFVRTMQLIADDADSIYAASMRRFVAREELRQQLWDQMYRSKVAAQADERSGLFSVGVVALGGGMEGDEAGAARERMFERGKWSIVYREGMPVPLSTSPAIIYPDGTAEAISWLLTNANPHPLASHTLTSHEAVYHMVCQLYQLYHAQQVRFDGISQSPAGPWAERMIVTLPEDKYDQHSEWLIQYLEGLGARHDNNEDDRDEDADPYIVNVWWM